MLGVESSLARKIYPTVTLLISILINPFLPKIPFRSPWKHHKTKSFLMFWGGVKKTNGMKWVKSFVAILNIQVFQLITSKNIIILHSFSSFWFLKTKINQHVDPFPFKQGILSPPFPLFYSFYLQLFFSCQKIKLIKFANFSSLIWKEI